MSPNYDVIIVGGGTKQTFFSDHLIRMLGAPQQDDIRVESNMVSL